ncbi:MAG: hypothetical protein KUL88_08215 [Rhizobium sp.]|nr:hypothetical protein [Rhizobium sp.]
MAISTTLSVERFVTCEPVLANSAIRVARDARFFCRHAGVWNAKPAAATATAGFKVNAWRISP